MGKAVGKEAKTVGYNPKDFDLPKVSPPPLPPYPLTLTLNP